MFTPEQTKHLDGPLSPSAVKKREQAGRKLSYIEGWHAIAEANRIFGYDAWCSETVECRCVAEHQRKVGKPPNQRDGHAVSYVARVRVTVVAGDRSIVREGVGSGHGIDVDLGLAHESAIKEAETDARKRALMTFGNPFGLALYDKEQRNVGDAAPASNVVGLHGEGALGHLVGLIKAARNERDLQRVTNAPANIKLFEAMDELDQDKVSAAVQDQRFTFSTTAAG